MNISDNPRVVVLAGQIAAGQGISVLAVLAVIQDLADAHERLAQSAERTSEALLTLREPLCEAMPLGLDAVDRNHPQYTNPARLARRERKQQLPGRRRRW